MPPKLSVVDYDAWEKGYMPPSEHCLIDALSYRGAKVAMASGVRETHWWLVVKGEFDDDIAHDIIGMLQIYLDGRERRKRTKPEPDADSKNDAKPA
jgi:hypothetical protein